VVRVATEEEGVAQEHRELVQILQLRLVPVVRQTDLEVPTVPLEVAVVVLVFLQLQKLLQMHN
jgi:hypothetical protein